MDDLIFNARRASPSPRRSRSSRGDLETRFRSLVQSPAARRTPPLSERAARGELRRRIADADVRPVEARRRELHPRARRLRRRADRARDTRRATRRERPDLEAAADQLDLFLERRANVSVEDQSPSVQRFREMIGRDEKMLVVFEWIRTAAKSDISVLILGPTGSGKEVVARMIHELSRRSAREVPGGELRGAARHAVRIRDLRLREGRLHRRARSASPDASSWPTTARCFSTKSPTCR